jgi:hypothetical protein
MWSQIKKNKWFVIHMFFYGAVLALAGNELYLYYSGAWYDPKKFIEYTEVVMLYLMCFGSLAMILYNDPSIKRRFTK